MNDKPLEALIAELFEDIKRLEAKVKKLEQENKFMEELNICLQQKNANPNTDTTKNI